MNALAAITGALLLHPDILLLPRWRVIADVRDTFACSDWLARTAYADARVLGHRRNRRDTAPYAKRAA